MFVQELVRSCAGKPETGRFVLSEPSLGVLDLTAPGWVVMDFQIGHPTERPIVRPRSLNDGIRDDSAFVGGRAITFSLMLNNNALPTQTLLDIVRPYFSPRYRPVLIWSHAGSRDDTRRTVVRGIDAPLPVARAKFPTLVCSFLAADAQIFSEGLNQRTFGPSASVESGRSYDETYDKDFPFSSPVGSTIVTNGGNGFADWTTTLIAGDGTMVNPSLFINDLEMSFDQNGGLTLLAGQTLVIDTKERSILIDGNPSTPAFDKVNFLDWSWADLQLQPGDNLVRVDFTGTSTNGVATIEWRDTWL
jgi:hypothetical protein